MRNVVASLMLVTSLIVGLAARATGAPAGTDAYTLGPGDTIEIVVVGDKDLSRLVTIKPDGSVDLPLVGEMTATGRTTSQLANDLVKRYSRYLKAPSITVTVHEFRVDRIYILGQVTHPGEYPIRPEAGILDLLASAGGPTTRADLAKATIIRGKETIPLDLLQALVKSRSPEVKLRSGDVLFVPETDRRMVVLGQVVRPGAYDLLEGQHVADLLAAGGGVTPQAAPQRAFIVRGGEQIPVDVKKILTGNLEANIPLVPGDTLVVPESKDKVAVLGAVNRGGTFDLTDDMKLLDAVALAGGGTNQANLSQVAILRLEGGRTKTIVANLGRALSGQDPSQNMPLQAGDAVYVPERGMTLEKAAQWFNIFYVLRYIVGFP